ncbi:response regulator [Algibacter amylolyticus]|uniref:histidine kinase n=1 Tax=Algibacter amylolyticus TaxID=1608400 RepID=A0A5M7BLG1_9FLAO|nr:two-component regulator propeller domain-containing protein [Algibacter amylolyticus]KAA5827735.1 response regulator [Algibacter amylolyticus]MBB5266957.1 signal transduction histidine kinase/ligand-binding sensor domain-containing protein/DNA-binding response OmpR family regulator [Algibacter amylolyticus]TSJ81980.1 response regulator [Algibacter amylolyticus]
MKYKLFFFFLFFVCSSHSQDRTFYHYGLIDGLSQQSIISIINDSNGFLWIGTQDGLNRFDGNTFKIYKHRLNDSLSISGNFINKLIENIDGTIWIATANNGVCYYNPKTDSFVNTKFNSGNFTALAHDKDGNIYATLSNQGFIKFKKKNDIYVANKVSLSNYDITNVTIQDSKMYLGTKVGELYTSKVLDTLNLEKLNVSIPKSSIEEIAIFKNNIFLGTSLGLFVYNGQTRKTNAVNLQGNNNLFSKELFIESIKIHDNVFYIGTDNGLFICESFDESSFTFNNINSFKGDREYDNSITSNRVYDILLYKDLLWIGTNNLDVLSLKPEVFKTINTKSELALNNNYVFSILKWHNYTFIGTRNGLHCIDKHGNIFLITKENTNEKLAYNVIRGMTVDGENNLWLATTKGVSVLNLDDFNPDKPEIISMYFNENDPFSLSNNKTRSVFKDHNNTMWVTTYGGGLNRFTGNLKEKKYSFELYKHDNSENSISSYNVFSIEQDKERNYWVTSEDGLNKLSFTDDDYQNPVFKVYRHEKNNPNGLKNNTTLHTHIDKQGVIWVATQGGLHRFDKANEVFKHYGAAEGLSNDYVYSILEDADNYLWLATNEGLFKFDKATEKFEHFTTKDGLQSSEFNLGAHFNDKANNLLYFGGVNGFNEFNPKQVSQLDRSGTLSFTSLKIKDAEVYPLTNPKVLQQSFSKTEKITLNFNDFPCYIAFSDLDLRPTNSNQFLYSLNDGAWNNLGDLREIQILDLPKGNHNLKIQGQSRNKIWTGAPLQLNIKVTPPWYKSNVAYFVYLTGFLSLIFFVYKLNLKHQLAGQEAKRLKELDALKSQFITNITHEFRTPLTIILGYVSSLKEKFINDSTVSKPIKSIERSSNNLLHLVNEMLDLAKLEQGKLKLNNSSTNLVAFTSYIITSFSSLAESNQVALNFFSSKDSIIMDFDVEKMRQIISNLITNAIKFSKPNTTVTVMLDAIDEHAIIKITDQGIGIPKDEILFVFDRFYRSSKITGKISGTGIGLALTKELVNLMNGSISVNSEESISTTFTIRIPIIHEALVTTAEFNSGVINPERVYQNNIQTKHLSRDFNSILIVEDNPEIANYIASILESKYSLLFAINGYEGFKLAEKNIPDIVITDVMMPKMNGYELTEQLQSTKTTNHIPVIMLTAKALQEDKLTGIKSGADVYLTKPFQKEELLLRIEMLITKRKQLQDAYAIKKIIAFDKPQLKKDKNIEFLEGVVYHIHNHIEDSDYNAAKLSEALNMSESQLYRKLKAITNKSTAIFIRSVRLEKGMELLESTNLTVSEIAYATGFSNPNWFGKAFKEEFRKSPSEMRN